jgi:hypothetical protein
MTGTFHFCIIIAIEKEPMEEPGRTKGQGDKKKKTKSNRKICQKEVNMN